MKKMKKSKAFTLIELLVVVAIIGIIATIAVVATRGVIGRARIARTLQSEASMHRYLGMDIVGWWKFDGDLKDISGYNNHGKWKGTDDPVPSEKWVAGVPGKGGSALEFDGTDDYVAISYDKLLNLDESFSIILWIKPSEEEATSFIVSRGSGLTSYNYKINQRSAGRIDYIISNSVGQQTLISPSVITKNNWFFLAMIYNDNSKKLRGYINGDFVGERAISEIARDTSEIRIGNFIGGGYHYKGLISDVRIYNSTLTSKQINTLYAETKHKYIAENNNKEK